ncbi:DUF4168 domain-containing protein [Roseovarius sp. E0-M6]|uniref:DUF4168 domain-containing protein n=1 Tax=Roseovarius sp. E0-M6 TaxID=3127118 RepID=UPI00300FA92E
MLKAKTVTTAIAALMIAGAPVTTMPAMAQQSSTQAEVSESELDAFVIAFENVLAIEQDYNSRLQTVSDEAEKQALIKEAQTKMTQAVEDAPDIEVDRYIEIVELAQADPDLQAELTSKLQN